ncbi:MAG: vWA domain-containing protein [Streptosporangiaceae bacterium]
MAIRVRGGAAGQKIRSRPTVAWILLSGLVAGLTLASLPSAAMVQARTISATNAGAFSVSGSTASSGQLGLLDVVVLVDESGSETPAKVADEKATTLEIATSMLSQQSRVTVVGFGGVNNVVPNQDPTNVACRPTIANSASFGYLTSCVNNLHRRSEADGDDTDYAAALGQAMSYFNPDTAYGQQSPAGATKVILMMTDGAADVHRDTGQYGTDWSEGELSQINDQLSIAKQDNVQFWALGFGTDIGTNVDGTLVTKAQALTYLNNMAAKGAPAVCDGQRAHVQPYARWVDNPDDAFVTLGQLSADASCSGYSGNKADIGGGVTSNSLTVQIPDYASGGVISVDRVSPSVGVTFVQPDGQPWNDSSALSGQDSSSVESLHLPDITNGEVGTWTINLTAPKSLASEVVRASAFWKGAVRAVISANPTSAKPSQPICSELSLLGPRGPISDPADITDLQVGITVSGDGLSQQVPISSTGQAGCPATGAGTYAGTVAAPSKSGTLAFTGAAAGYGLSTTYIPATVTVGTSPPPFTAVIRYPPDQAGLQVQAGNGLPLTVAFTNDTGSAQKVRLAVSGSGSSPFIAGTASELTVPASPSSKTVPFMVDFPQSSPKGLTQVQVGVADAANPSHSYATASFDVTVTRPPGIWDKYGGYIIGAIILLILIALFLRWRRAVTRWRMDVRGLTTYLRRDGAQLSELPAKSRPSDSFRFVIQDLDERAPRLDYEESGLPPYTIRRSGNREVTLTTPAGVEHEDVVLGQDAVPVPGTKLQLAFDDDRRRPKPWWVAGAARGPRRRRKKPQPPAPPSFGTPGQEPLTPTPGAPEPTRPAEPSSEGPATNELW